MARLRLAEPALSLAAGECGAVFDPRLDDLLPRIAGLARLSRFTVWLDGMDAALMPPSSLRVGQVGLPEEVGARRSLGHYLGARPADAARVLALVGMIGAEPRIWGEMSAYDQRRASLAKALLENPRLLILADPLAGLAPAAQMPFLRLVQKIRAQMPDLALLLNSPRREDVLMLADRVMVFEQGELLQQGSPRELYERPDHPFVAGLLGDVNLLPVRVVEGVVWLQVG